MVSPEKWYTFVIFPGTKYNWLKVLCNAKTVCQKINKTNTVWSPLN